MENKKLIKKLKNQFGDIDNMDRVIEFIKKQGDEYEM